MPIGNKQHRAAARRAFLWLALWPLCVPAFPAAAQTPAGRVVIGYDVLCRAAPDRSSAMVRKFQPGESFTVRGQAESPDGAVWYEQDLGRRGACWVFGPLTVPSSAVPTPDAALLALTEHALGLGTEASFEHLVALDNLLIQRERQTGPHFSVRTEMPPLLALRHLQLVDRAARAVGDFRWAGEDPLKRSWVLARPNVVRFFEPGALYYVPVSHFWELYDRHRDSPEAEAIAWAAAETPVYTDECYTECLLRVLAQTYLPYWSEFPDGEHVARAIAAVAERMERAANYCVPAATGSFTIEPGPLDMLVLRFRASLEPVADAGKSGLLAHLADIEQNCLAGTRIR